MKKLTEIEIKNQLLELINWTLQSNSITTTLILKDFNTAMEVVNQIAKIANELNHHPEWYNVYNKLEIKLTTHDVNGLSNIDFIFAKKIDLLISKYLK